MNNAKALAARLRRYNRWRRGEGEYAHVGDPANYRPFPVPENPKDLGRLFDEAADFLEAVEEAPPGPFARRHEKGLPGSISCPHEIDGRRHGGTVDAVRAFSRLVACGLAVAGYYLLLGRIFALAICNGAP